LIFKWLGKRGDKDILDASRQNLEAITGSATALLQQVSDWVSEQIDNDQLDLELLRLADTRLEPALAEISKNLPAQRRLGTGHRLLRAYCERFARAYVHVARKLPATHKHRLDAFLRAANLFCRACRLARMSHDDPGELRKEIIAVYLEAQQQKLADERKLPYPGMAETSVTQELAIALLWETAAFDTLSLDQIDYLERFIVFHGNRIIVKTTAGATTPFAVFADGRVAAIEPTKAAAAVLFIGPGPLVGVLAACAKLSDNASLPVWAGTQPPHTDMQTLKSLALRMLAVWEQKRIKRNNERKARNGNVRVTGGFDNIRRAIAYATYVRGGGQLDIYGTERIISERVREVMVGLTKEKGQLAPVDVLAVMEAAGDSKAVESWGVCDSSDQGYSLAVPGFRGWLAVGGLIALREGHQIDWRIAIVRRLFGAGNARRVGIEIFKGIPSPVGVGGEGQTKDVGLADLRDAIMITGDSLYWLITTFACSLDATYLVAGQHGRQLFRITAHYCGNADYGVYACQPTT